MIASFVVPTGQVLWHLGPTRTSEDFAAHLADVHRQLPAMARYDWVVDNLNTHWSLEVCRLVAAWCHLPFDPKTLQHRMWVDRDGARLSLMSQRVWGLRQHSEAGLQVGLRADAEQDRHPPVPQFGHSLRDRPGLQAAVLQQCDQRALVSACTRLLLPIVRIR